MYLSRLGIYCRFSPSMKYLYWLSLQRMKTCLSPSAAWGPAHPSHREEWVQHRLKYPLRHRLLHPDFGAASDTSASLDGVLLDKVLIELLI